MARSTTLPLGSAIWMAAALLTAGGCTVNTPPALDGSIVFRDTPRPDVPPASSDAGPPPACELDAHLGASCDTDLDCDDHCFCNGREACAGGTCVAGTQPCSVAACATVSCTESARCAGTPDDSLCDDGDPCNGAERCDVASGCRLGPPPSCNDANVCTIDACMVDVGCVYEPFDGDGDGEPSRTCGGMDCNDANPMIVPGAAEVCDNGIDDNCDGVTDVAAPECAPTNDDCGSAEVLSPADMATSRYRRSTFGFASDTTMTCTPSSTDTRRDAPDAVFRFTLAERRDVTLAVEGLAYNAGIILRAASACTAGPDLQCQVTSSSTVEPVLHYRSLPAGDYAIFVKTRTAGPFTLAITLDAATTPNDTCVPEVVDISAGGLFTGSIDDDDYVLSCHTTTSSTYDDAVLRLVVPAGEFRDVHLSATVRSPTGSTTTGYLQLTSDCDSTSPATLGCDSGTSTAPAFLDFPGLGEGVYYVLLEGAYTTAGSGTYELTAVVAPSSGRAAGDSCDAGVPIVLSPGTAADLDLSTLAVVADAGPFCGANRPGYHDGFFQFALASESDVVITTTSSARHWLGLSSTCGSVPRVRDCAGSTSGAVMQRFYRVPAGTHFVNVSTLADAGNLAVLLETLPATPRESNDLCSGASLLVDGVPADFDLVAYDDDQQFACGALDDVDAYFTFTLATPRFVSLRAEGATSMALVPGTCADAASRCVTGGPPQIAEVLPAGVYYVAVESAPLVAGSTRLRFTTSDP